MEHVEGALTIGDVDGEALASLPVGDGDDHAIVALAPEQPDVDAVIRAAVELAEGIGHGAEKVPAEPRRGNTGAPASRPPVAPTYLPWLARRLKGCAGQFMPTRGSSPEPPQSAAATRHVPTPRRAPRLSRRAFRSRPGPR